MTLINTDGMSFIGPGSEWFWTAVSGLVLAVTFLAIYRQLRLQSSQSAIEQLESYDHEWKAERFIRYRLELLVAIRDGLDPANIPGGASWAIGGFWEKIAGLVRAGHIDAKLLWNANGSDCAVWWTTLAPSIQRLRTDTNGPAHLEHFEWLAGIMHGMDIRAGTPPADWAWVMANMDRRIAMYEDMIRVEQSLRAVIVASLEVTPAAPPATASLAEG